MIAVKKLRLPIILLFCLISNVGCEEKRRAGLTLSEVFQDRDVRALADNASRGDTNGIDRLLDRNVSVNSVGSYGITPLWWALATYASTADEKSYHGFTHLLEKGANPNFQIKAGYYNVMYFAAMVKDTRLLAAAIKAGGDVNLIVKAGDPGTPLSTSEGATPIFATIYGRNRANLDLLIANGANLNAQDANGCTPMIIAAYINDYATVFRLISCGADPSLKNNLGLTIEWNLKNNRMSQQSDGYKWMQKVIILMKQKGFNPDTQSN